MSEEKKRKSKEEKVEEVLDAGRTFASLSKVEPEIWAYLEKEAILSGRKKHELLADWIAEAIIQREVIAKGLTMEQLLAAWDIKDKIERALFNKVVALGTTLFGTLLQQVGSMVSGIKEYQEEQIAKIVEEEKKRDVDYQLRMARAKMAAQLMESMLPMIMASLSSIKIPGIGGVAEKTVKESKVEVEVIEDERPSGKDEKSAE